MNSEFEKQIVSINIPAEKKYLPIILSVVKQAASMNDFEEKDLHHFELIVEEACVNVIEHAFEPGERGEYTVKIIRRPQQLVIAVEDNGLPFDIKKIQEGKSSGLGMLLMNAFADQINYINLGRNGKRIELIKNLFYQDVDFYLSEEEKNRSEEVQQAPADEEIKFEMMNADDSIQLSRCVYRSYGYTYPSDHIYFPDKIRELIESKLVESVIIKNPDGEIIGHLALIFSNPNAKVAESGQAVVDPRYRGRNLFKLMKEYLILYAKQKGMYGIYSEAVSIHPYTQKGNISIGATETGVLLAFIPPTATFKKINESSQSFRQSAVLFYLQVNENPFREIFPPFHHKGIIIKTIERNKLDRAIGIYDEETHGKITAVNTILNVSARVDFGFGYLRLIEYGLDFEEVVEYRLHELRLKKLDMIFIDLPLSNPFTQIMSPKLEMMGFFYCGIIPELYDGDVVRFQYLNNVDVDSQIICTASDFGKELLEYIIKQKEASM